MRNKGQTTTEQAIPNGTTALTRVGEKLVMGRYAPKPEPIDPAVVADFLKSKAEKETK